MKLQPDLCPKCGLDILPTEPECPLCALRRKHNRIFARVCAGLAAVAATVAFITLRPTAPPQRAALTAPMPAALPAPTAMPIVIQDAPFTYNADTKQFADSQPPAIPRSQRADAPIERRAPHRIASAPQPATPQNYEDPLSREQRARRTISQMAQLIRETNDPDELARIRHDLIAIQDAINKTAVADTTKGDFSQIGHIQTVQLKISYLISAANSKQYYGGTASDFSEMFLQDATDTNVVQRGEQLRAQVRNAQRESDAMALNR